jgi:hypothetical protein
MHPTRPNNASKWFESHMRLQIMKHLQLIEIIKHTKYDKTRSKSGFCVTCRGDVQEFELFNPILSRNSGLLIPKSAQKSKRQTDI